VLRFYANENYPLPVVEELRRLGHDVVTTQELGKAGLKIPDEEVLEAAIAMNRAVITHNKTDFIRLHSWQPNHCGIVVCTSDTDFIALAHRIHDALSQAGSVRGQLVRINRPQS
jgi:predicted nuclease of predicted toxin-antitoxin system